MNYEPEVSVVIPVFNAASTLRRALWSVRKQCFHNWEIIIVDDGSNDGSTAIALDAAYFEKRIRVVFQSNSGPSAARNHGIREARGRFVAFLDADDQWTTNRLSRCLEHFGRNPQTGLVFSRVAIAQHDADEPSTETPHFPELTAADLIAENPVCTTSNIMIRKSALAELRGFDETMAYIEDQDLVLRTIVQTGWRVEGIDEVLLTYRLSQMSRSTDFKRTEQSWRRLFVRARKWSPGLAGRYSHVFTGAFLRNQARRALRSDGTIGVAARSLFRAFLADPFILFRQPRRTSAVIAGLAISLLPLPQLKEIVR
jgi:glycosyltransferase involved in cell wall biosynthesis